MRWANLAVAQYFRLCNFLPRGKLRQLIHHGVEGVTGSSLRAAPARFGPLTFVPQLPSPVCVFDDIGCPEDDVVATLRQNNNVRKVAEISEPVGNFTSLYGRTSNRA